MMLCQHEETAVQIAHWLREGERQADGRDPAQPRGPAAREHGDLLRVHRPRAVFIIGATGPMDETKRRPRIDWIHTAQGQGEAVRQYTKWDYQPHTSTECPSRSRAPTA
jgi:acetolactate synthase-1/2/3 large subunit